MKVEKYLKQLGLTGEQAAVYVTLVQDDTLSALELSRKTKISRTQVYRVLEQLKKLELVEEVIDEHRKLARAVSPSRLEHLVSRTEAKVKQMREVLPEVTGYLHQIQGTSPSQTQVKYYQGRSGIQQMLYNILASGGAVVGYSHVELMSYTGARFAARFAQEFEEAGMSMRDIYSDNYLESIGGIEHLNSETSFLSAKTNVESRYLPNEKLTIDHQMDIHGDTVSIYNWHEDEVFGVEIVNEKVARMQRQIFELLWGLAEVK